MAFNSWLRCLVLVDRLQENETIQRTRRHTDILPLYWENRPIRMDFYTSEDHQHYSDVYAEQVNYLSLLVHVTTEAHGSVDVAVEIERVDIAMATDD